MRHSSESFQSIQATEPLISQQSGVEIRSFEYPWNRGEHGQRKQLTKPGGADIPFPDAGVAIAPAATGDLRIIGMNHCQTVHAHGCLDTLHEARPRSALREVPTRSAQVRGIERNP